MVTKRDFKSLEEHGAFYEVSTVKRSGITSLPIKIALFVYDGAKKNILSLEYDLLRTYCLYNHYQLILTDTDSLMIGLGSKDGRIESIVKPELRAEFFASYNNFFPLQACARHHNVWLHAMLSGVPFVQKECCNRVEKLDSVTPLLFKREWFGKRAVALCAKTYFSDGNEKTGERDKASAKLGTKGLNRQENLRYNHFDAVLTSQKGGIGLNQGIISKKSCPGGRRMFTYYQRRHSLAYLYMKKVVDSDGVTCWPTKL